MTTDRSRSTGCASPTLRPDAASATSWADWSARSSRSLPARRATRSSSSRAANSQAQGIAALELGVSWVGTRALMWAIESKLDRTARPVPLGGRDRQGRRPRAAQHRRLRQGRGGQAADAGVRARHGLEHDGQLRRPAHRRPRAVGGARAALHRRHLRLRAPHAVGEPDRERARSSPARCPPARSVSLVSHSRGGLVADLLCLDRLRRADRRASRDRRTCPAPATPTRTRPAARSVAQQLDDAHAEQRAQLRELADVLRDKQLVRAALRARRQPGATAPSWRAATSTCSSPAC